MSLDTLTSTPEETRRGTPANHIAVSQVSENTCLLSECVFTYCSVFTQYDYIVNYVHTVFPFLHTAVKSLTLYPVLEEKKSSGHTSWPSITSSLR